MHRAVRHLVVCVVCGVCAAMPAAALDTTDTGTGLSAPANTATPDTTPLDPVLDSVPEASADTSSTSPAPDTTAESAPVPADTAPQDTMEDENDEVLLDENELFIEGEEELIIDEENIAQPSADTIAQDTTGVAADTARAAQPMDTVPAPPGVPEPVPDEHAVSREKKDTTGDAFRITEAQDTRMINFAKNLDDYRSPKIAMLLSFILPGLGEAYTKQYIRAAGFFLADVALVGTVFHFRQKAKDYRKKAQTHADTAYVADSMRLHYERLQDMLRNLPDSSIANNEQAIDSILNLSYTFFADFSGSDTFSIESFVKQAENKNDDFYDAIQDERFIQGWKDCQPVLEPDRSHGDTVTVTGFFDQPTRVVYDNVSPQDSIPAKFTVAGNDMPPQWGFSHYYDTYTDLITKKNTEYNNAQLVMVFMLVNRIISALDAGICAQAYNQKLLEEESVWQRIRLDSRIVHGNNGLGMECGLSISF